MKVEIISKETIKPLSPTPDHLKNFKLSLLDQLAPPCYGALVLFYAFNNSCEMNDPQALVSERSHQLKKALSEISSRYYPLAGRVKDNITIDCRDYGAVYVEARVTSRLLDFLEQPNREAIKKFIPVEAESAETSTEFLLLVQSSFFSCGGVAIGVCISHKIADAATVSTFIKSWAASTLGYGDQLLPLLHNASSLFPPRKFSTTIPPAANFTKEKCVTKRFVFYVPEIAALKVFSSSESVQEPTRVEAVTALIWKCATNASRSNSGVPKLSMLSQSVNIRSRTCPPLPGNSIGNLVGYFAAQKNDSHIELKGLVGELRKGMQNFSENYVEKLRRDDSSEAITESLKEALGILRGHDTEFYICSSLCNFPLYDIDFGWGKPIWVTSIPSGRGNQKNLLTLIDTGKGDGSVEAWVSLSEADMALFERDPELLAYASANPSVINTAKESRLFKSRF